MNNTRIDINPAPFVPPVRIIHHLELQVINIELFKRATVMVSMFDELGGIIENKCLYLTKEQYDLWNHDDETLVSLVLAILGYTKNNEIHV
jgi:hypothetical protein